MAIDWSTTEITSFYELYKVNYLAQYWYYTSADHEIVYGGNTYTPASIKRNETAKDSDLNPIKMELTFPITDFARKYIAFAPVNKTYITIYLFQDVDNVIQAFKGVVAKIALGENNACTVSLDEYGAMAVKLPKLIISPACNHCLFDDGCTLDSDDYKYTVNVDYIASGTQLTISGGGIDLLPPDYFLQGIVEFEGDQRFVTKEVNTDATYVYIQVPFFDLEVDDTVYIWPGCNKSPATCRDKFDNLTNYLGSPKVGRKNPVLVGF